MVKLRSCLMAGACEAALYHYTSIIPKGTPSSTDYYNRMNRKARYRCPNRSGSYSSQGTHCEREWVEANS